MKAFLTASMLLSLMLASTVIALSQSYQATFALGPAGVALQPGNVLVVATNLSNTSDKDASKVQIHSITLGSEPKEALAPLLTPTAFPVLVGDIGARQSSTLQASFDGKPLTPRKQYLLVMNGSYEGHEFTVTTTVVFPPAAPGSSPFKTKTIESHHIYGAPFPPQKPSFDVDPRVHVPVPMTAPIVPGTRTKTPTVIKPAPSGDPPEILFEANNSLGISEVCGDPTSCPIEPSGARAGKVVFVSANWYAAYSVNGGSSFTKVDPTTIFPGDLGFCCDQVVIYAPTIDRFIWLMQGQDPAVTPIVVPPSAINPLGKTINPFGYRLAVASPADIVNNVYTAWTYSIFKPSDYGCFTFDYPDLSVSKKYLYMSWDAESFDASGNLVFSPCEAGLLVLRVP